MKSASILSFVRISLIGPALIWAAQLYAAAKPAPQVSVSLRGVAGQTVEQGEPWRVVLRLDLPRGSTESVVLAPGSGTWAEAIAVELFPAGGNTAAARAEPVGKPDAASATLDAKHVAGGLWRFSAAAMQAISPGSYRLKVQLKIDSGGGWKGVAAREIPLTVVAPATKPSAQRIVNRAQDLLLTDKVQEAAALVDAELKDAPRDYALLKVRAVIAEKAGNPFAATMCLNAANFSTAKKTAGQPAAEDGEMLARLEKAGNTAPADFPAWTWPPAEVLTAFGQEAQKSSFVPAMPPDRPAGARNETSTPIPANLPPSATPAPSNPVSAATPTSVSTTPSQPTPVATPPAAASAATSSPLAPAGPPPGVIVPAAKLSDEKIAADAAGQWATEAKAGSQYSSPTYSAARATGAPDVPVTGDSPSAWCPAAQSGGNDWLEVSFSKPVNATEVRVRQSNCPGAIVKVEAFEADGTAHVWWEGADTYKHSDVRETVWFAVRVPKTSYLVAKIKITLNLSAVPGWKQIDAVQLVGAVP